MKTLQNRAILASVVALWMVVLVNSCTNDRQTAQLDEHQRLINEERKERVVILKDLGNIYKGLSDHERRLEER